MKTNTINKAQRWLLRYSLVLCLFFSVLSLFSQKVSKTFTKEINLSPSSTIITKGPCAMGFNMNGRITTSTVGNKYTIVPGANDGIAALTVNDYQIFTWDKNAIKQVVEIIIQPDEEEPGQTQSLLDHLQIKLKADAANVVNIDDNMNIASFGFNNGWFSGNESFIILDNGQKYPIKSISIKSSLYIPKQSNLQLSAENIPITIGDLDGKLNLEVRSASLNVGNVEELEASLQYCTATFQSISDAKINGVNSSVTTACVNSLLVGSKEYSIKMNLQNHLFNDDYGLSYSTVYNIEAVEELSIYKTTLDKFNIEKIGKLESLQSIFTDYTIKELTSEVLLSAQNGDLSVESVGAKFKSIQLENDISTIHLGMKESPDYRVKLFWNEFTEYNISKELMPLSTKGNWEKAYYKGDQTKGGEVLIRCNNCRVMIQ